MDPKNEAVEEKAPEAPAEYAEPQVDSATEEAAEEPAMDIYGLLSSIPEAPSKEKIEMWKKSTDVEASVFSETEVYIWRPITWHEYKTLQQSAAENAQNPNFFDEQILYKCVLWPKILPETMPVLKGGTVPTLAQQIMEGSNFIPPQMAMNLVVKL